MIKVAIGVVNEGYDTNKKPGREDGTVGYQTDGFISHVAKLSPTKGIKK